MRSDIEPSHPSGLAAAVVSPTRGSRPVETNQGGAHPRLEFVVRKHLATVFLRPPAAYSRQAYDELRRRWSSGPLVLDSACGTGESTAAISRRHPHAFVVGIDQSAERIERGRRKLRGAWPDNALLLRADAPDLWALLSGDGVTLERHYLLYPNPWPKSEHLQRRWHGHPRFPQLLALGGEIELRTNWHLYAGEFAAAVRCAGWRARLAAVADAEPLSPFERKYRDSGHALTRVTAQAGNTPVDR